MGVVFLFPLQRALRFGLLLVCAWGQDGRSGQDKAAVAELPGGGFIRDCVAQAVPGVQLSCPSSQRSEYRSLSVIKTVMQ